jgi:plasmid stabilization system protein ParE
MKVTYSPRSIAQLASIFSYIAKDDPVAAAGVVDRAETSIALLGEQPEMGRRTSREGVHMLVVETYYQVFYRVLATRNEVRVLRVRDGRRRALGWERSGA